MTQHLARKSESVTTYVSQKTFFFPDLLPSPTPARRS
jgi:hypothetical protein